MEYLQLGVIINLDLLLAASGWVCYIELHTGPNYPGPTTHKTQALKRASLATVRTCKAWRLMTFITYVAAEREFTQHANAFAMANDLDMGQLASKIAIVQSRQTISDTLPCIVWPVDKIDVTLPLPRHLHALRTEAMRLWPCCLFDCWLSCRKRRLLATVPIGLFCSFMRPLSCRRFRYGQSQLAMAACMPCFGSQLGAAYQQ